MVWSSWMNTKKGLMYKYQGKSTAMDNLNVLQQERTLQLLPICQLTFSIVDAMHMKKTNFVRDLGTWYEYI